MRVIVTRPGNEARRWVEDLRRLGFDARSLPLIAILPAPDASPVEAAWLRLATCRAVMFVSGNAVRLFFALRPPGIGWPHATRAWATGPGTRQALIDAGVAPPAIDTPAPGSAQFDSETLWQQVENQLSRGDRVLVVRGQDAGTRGVGREWLADQMLAAGAEVETAVSYVRSAPAWTAAQEAEAREAVETGSIWLFSSSQAITNLELLLPGVAWARARAMATHPRIAEAARRAGFGVVYESRPSLDAVTAALESFR